MRTERTTKLNRTFFYSLCCMQRLWREAKTAISSAHPRSLFAGARLPRVLYKHTVPSQPMTRRVKLREGLQFAAPSDPPAATSLASHPYVFPAHLRSNLANSLPPSTAWTASSLPSVEVPFGALFGPPTNIILSDGLPITVPAAALDATFTAVPFPGAQHPDGSISGCTALAAAPAHSGGISGVSDSCMPHAAITTNTITPVKSIGLLQGRAAISTSASTEGSNSHERMITSGSKVPKERVVHRQALMELQISAPRSSKTKRRRINSIDPSRTVPEGHPRASGLRMSACTECHRMKTACDAGDPCSRCARFGKVCVRRERVSKKGKLMPRTILPSLAAPQHSSKSSPDPSPDAWPDLPDLPIAWLESQGELTETTTRFEDRPAVSPSPLASASFRQLRSRFSRRVAPACSLDAVLAAAYEIATPPSKLVTQKVWVRERVYSR